MGVKPIPDGYHAVTPYSYIEGVDRLLKFVKQAFDATEILRVPRPDGSTMHAEVRIGGSAVMMGGPTGPAAQFGPIPSSIYLYVTNCDAVYQRALEAGGMSDKEVQDISFNGERYGGVKDPVGNTWWIATHVKVVSIEESMKQLKAAEGRDEKLRTPQENCGAMSWSMNTEKIVSDLRRFVHISSTQRAMSPETKQTTAGKYNQKENEPWCQNQRGVVSA